MVMMVRQVYLVFLERWEREDFPDPEVLLDCQVRPEFLERKDLLGQRETKDPSGHQDQLECQETRVLLGKIAF